MGNFCNKHIRERTLDELRAYYWDKNLIERSPKATPKAAITAARGKVRVLEELRRRGLSEKMIGSDIRG